MTNYQERTQSGRRRSRPKGWDEEHSKTAPPPRESKERGLCELVEGKPQSARSPDDLSSLMEEVMFSLLLERAIALSDEEFQTLVRALASIQRLTDNSGWLLPALGHVLLQEIAIEQRSPLELKRVMAIFDFPICGSRFPHSSLVADAIDAVALMAKACATFPALISRTYFKNRVNQEAYRELERATKSSEEAIRKYYESLPETDSRSGRSGRTEFTAAAAYLAEYALSSRQ